MKILRGRTAFITGAASGIGRAITLALAREGVDLILTDIDATGLARTEQEVRSHGVKVTSVVCDLLQPDDIRKLLDAQFSTGPLHILVNCAGIALYGQQRNVADSDWRRLMAINLMAPMQITTHLINKLAAAEEAHIVNIASIFGLVPARQLATYQASKYGLVGFTQAIRNDYHRSNFGVSVICPGYVKTPIQSKVKMVGILSSPDARARVDKDFTNTKLLPETVAERTLQAIRRNEFIASIGREAVMVGIFKRWAPSLLERALRG